MSPAIVSIKISVIWCTGFLAWIRGAACSWKLQRLIFVVGRGWEIFIIIDVINNVISRFHPCMFLLRLDDLGIDGL